MRHWHISLLLCMAGLSAAADQVGPFQWSSRYYDPANPVPTAICRDGSVANVKAVSGDLASGVCFFSTWSGDTQAGGRSVDGVNLFGPAGQNAFIALRKDWVLNEGGEGGLGWVYYPKFQQDGVLALGFADCDAAELNTASGVGFALENTLPYDRVIVSLPWRWIQGGGSGYQTGSYGGNPPEAGVFAIPAGMSLSDAQKQAATYRLAGLDGLLKEVQPHMWTPSFKLQLLGGGRWQVVIDIDSNGQIDYVSGSDDDGNKLSPFADLDERSGLIVSNRSLMGIHGGFVGQTQGHIVYQMSETSELPAKNCRPFIAKVPTKVKASPTIIHGQAWGASYPILVETSAGHSSDVTPMGSTKVWFEDVPLDPTQDTLITFIQGVAGEEARISRLVEWVPVDMYRNETATIRVGDQIKLQCVATCGAETISIDADGDGLVDYEGPDGAPLVYGYEKAGVYTAKAFNVDGELIGASEITVADIRLPKRISCQVGFTRVVDIHTGLHDPADLYITTNDSQNPTGTIEPKKGRFSPAPALIAASAQADIMAENHMRIRLTVVDRGEPVLHVRHGSVEGPILAMKIVDEFVANTFDTQHIAINHDTSEANIRYEMTPFIPDLDVTFTTFANKASFDGDRSKSFSTNDAAVVLDEATGETKAVLDVPMFVPAGESKFCISGKVYEASDISVSGNKGGKGGNGGDTGGNSSDDSENTDKAYNVGDSLGVNGDGCRIKVSRLVFPDTKKPRLSAIKVDKKNRGKGPAETVTVQEPDWKITESKRSMGRWELRVKIQQTCKGKCSRSSCEQKKGTCQRSHCDHVHEVAIVPDHKNCKNLKQHGNGICQPYFKNKTNRLNKKCGYKQHQDFEVKSCQMPGYWDVKVDNTVFKERIIIPGMTFTKTKKGFEPEFDTTHKPKDKGKPVETTFTVNVIGKEYIDIDYGMLVLYNTSSEPGYCMNFPLWNKLPRGNKRHSNIWKDLRFCKEAKPCRGECDCPGDTWKAVKNGHKFAAQRKGDGLDGSTVTVFCDDFGAYAKLGGALNFSIKKGINCDGSNPKCSGSEHGNSHCSGSSGGCDKAHGDECMWVNPCECMEPNREKDTKYLSRARRKDDWTEKWTKLPVDEDGNDIWDGWTHNRGGASDDAERYIMGNKRGDGWSRYEEYRGAVVLDVVDKSDGGDVHKRTNPKGRNNTYHIYNKSSLDTSWFRDLCGLEVLFINPRHAYKRALNANRESHQANGVDQRGVELRVEVVPQYTGKCYGFDRNTLTEPHRITKVAVDKREIDRNYEGQPSHGAMLKFVTAHELMHSINAHHHSDADDAARTLGDDCIMRYFRRGEDITQVGTITKMKRICGGKSTTNPKWDCSDQTFNVKDTE